MTDWLDIGIMRYAADPTLPGRLIAKVTDSMESLTPEDTATLTVHSATLHNKLEAAVKRHSEAKDIFERAAAEKEMATLNEELDELDEAVHMAGTIAGRSLVARQLAILRDFSFAGIRRRTRAKKGSGEGGDPALSAEELEIIRGYAERIEEWEKRLAEAVARADALEAIQDEIDAAPKGEPKKGRKKAPSKRKQVAKEKLDTAWEKAKKAEKEFAKSVVAGSLPAALPGAGKVVAAYAELAGAFIEAGVVTFQEFVKTLQAEKGKAEVDKIDPAILREAWRQAKIGEEWETFDLTADETDEIYNLTRKMVKSLVKAGVRDRNTIIQQVHQELDELIPSEWTMEDTMKSIAQFDRYRPLNKDEDMQEVRRITGETLQLVRYLGVRKGRIAPKKGMEQYEPEDKQRQMEKSVRGAMRRRNLGGFSDERRLKTALDTAKNALRRMIADLEAGRRRTRRKLEPDDELIALRKQYAELKAATEDPAKTQEQKEKQLVNLLERMIKRMAKDISEGNIWGKQGEKLSSKKIDARRQMLRELRAVREAQRQKDNPEYQYTAILQRRLTQLRERLANEEYYPPKRKERELTQEQATLLGEIEDEKARLRQWQDQLAYENMSPAQRWGVRAFRSISTVRASLTSFELSGFLRQGGLVWASHPKMAARVFKPMLRAARTKEGFLRIQEEISNRDNAKSGFYDRVKLGLTDPYGRITRQEEEFLGHWFKEEGTGGIVGAGIRASERAYVAALNLYRANLFDALATTLSKDGQITVDQGKIIANYVNVITGRGPLPFRLESAAGTLSLLFFAPRYVASRFQFLLGRPLRYKPSDFRGLTKEQIAAKKAEFKQARDMIRKEYARVLAGYAIFYGTLPVLAGAMAAMGYDDDELPKVSFDPRSSDFGKPRFGKTRLDPLAGLSQVIVLIGRSLFGKTKPERGPAMRLRGRTDYGARELADVWFSFGRSKLAPLPGAIVDVLLRNTVPGKTLGNVRGVPSSREISWARWGLERTAPITWMDIESAAREQDLPVAGIMAMLAILGVGLQTYD
jgi:hypothetical protein